MADALISEPRAILRFPLYSLLTALMKYFAAATPRQHKQNRQTEVSLLGAGRRAGWNRRSGMAA